MLKPNAYVYALLYKFVILLSIKITQTKIKETRVAADTRRYSTYIL